MRLPTLHWPIKAISCPPGPKEVPQELARFPGMHLILANMRTPVTGGLFEEARAMDDAATLGIAGRKDQPAKARK